MDIVIVAYGSHDRLCRCLHSLRTNPPTEIGRLKVVGFEDLRDEHGRMGPFKGETDKAARNFLIFRLGGTGIDGKVCLRPSGTEPKAKAYIEVASAPCPAGTADAVWQQTKATVDTQVQKLATEQAALCN